MNCFWQMKICSAKKSNAPPNLIQYIKTFSKYHMKVFVKCKISIHFLQGIFDKKKLISGNNNDITIDLSFYQNV